MQLIGPINSGSATGGAGAATANADTTAIVSGKIQAIYLTYNDSPPAGTTDVTIATKGTNAPANTIVAVANAATSGWFYPRHTIDDAAGAEVATEYTAVPVHDYINVKIAQANDGDSVDAYLLVD